MAYGDIDRAAADVGQALDINVPLEPGGKSFVPVDVLKACRTVLINTEPCAVAECVAPGSELIEERDEILANGAGNQAGFVQGPVEFAREAVQTVGLGSRGVACTTRTGLHGRPLREVRSPSRPSRGARSRWMPECAPGIRRLPPSCRVPARRRQGPGSPASQAAGRHGRCGDSDATVHGPRGSRGDRGTLRGGG